MSSALAPSFDESELSKFVYKTAGEYTEKN